MSEDNRKILEEVINVYGDKEASMLHMLILLKNVVLGGMRNSDYDVYKDYMIRLERYGLVLFSDTFFPTFTKLGQDFVIHLRRGDKGERVKHHSLDLTNGRFRRSR